jgi:endonuclease YncB( thermonuclease family)
MGNGHPQKSDSFGRVSRRTTLALGLSTPFLLANTKLPDVPKLVRGERGSARRIIDGDSFVLALKDGSELGVRLSAIQAPRTQRRADSYRGQAWPFAAEAQAGLTGLIKGRPLQLSYGKTRRDRFARAVAQVHTLSPDGKPDLWVQQELVRLGLARVYSWRGETADMAALYAAEGEARDRSRGIWSDDFYAIRTPDPDPLAQYVDSLQIVEGIVTSVADVRGRVYLNFGADYKTDFTVAIAKKNVKRFAELDLLNLTGARVRARGWMEMINGPMIWMDHPGRLEILS